MTEVNRGDGMLISDVRNLRELALSPRQNAVGIAKAHVPRATNASSRLSR